MPPGTSKIIWLVANPASMLTVMLLVGAIMLFTGWARFGRTIVVTVALAAAAISYSPLSDWLIEPLENRFARPSQLPEKVTGIIVLGGAIDTRQTKRHNDIALNARAERVTAFAALARRYPQAKLVYTGGAGESDAERDSESFIAKPFLESLGIAEARVIAEARARDTYENALMTHRLIRPQDGEVWIVITSAAHMPRAVGAFRRVGWNVIPFPVDYRQGARNEDTFGHDLSRGLNVLNVALREWLSLAHYYVTGRSARFLPGE